MQTLLVVLGVTAAVCIVLYLNKQRRLDAEGKACLKAGPQQSSAETEQSPGSEGVQNTPSRQPEGEVVGPIEGTQELEQGPVMADREAYSSKSETGECLEEAGQDVPTSVAIAEGTTPQDGLEGRPGMEPQPDNSPQDSGHQTEDVQRELLAVVASRGVQPQGGGDSQSGQQADQVRSEVVSRAERQADDVAPNHIAPRAPQKARADRTEPAKRGGRRPTPAHETEKPPSHQPKRSQATPEIVCWKRERQWIAAVQVPEDFVADPDLAVMQDGQPLTQDESREDCWHLRRAAGQVSVRSSRNESLDAATVALGEQSCLLFKLSLGNQDQGRRVKYATHGSFLVIAPDDWKRDEVMSGTAPVEPEPVSISSYTAHFFNLEKDGPNKIAFWASAGTHQTLDSKVPTFELVGNHLSDANERMGPLFGGGPPRIRSVCEEGWQDIGTIVIGEEGSGTGKWRTAFRRSAASAEQELRSALDTREAGWYFVRLYDPRDDLVESLDFRFATGLGEIRVPQPEPFPSQSGHGSVTVEFHHTTDCVVEAADRHASALHVEREAGRTRVVVPASPGFDQTHWEVKCRSGSCVKISVLVERIWWSRGREHLLPAQTEWSDRPLVVERDGFKATSDAVLYLWLPKPRWVDEVLVGFAEDKRRTYSAPVDSRCVSIPLREFGDAAELAHRFRDSAFRAWINSANGEESGVVAVVRREEPPFTPVSGLMRHPELWLATISSARLAGTLNLLSSKVRGPLRGVMQQLYAVRPRRRGRRGAEVSKFKERALCAIALACESVRDGSVSGFTVPKRRQEQASRAAQAFPETLERLRRRSRPSRLRRMPR